MDLEGYRRVHKALSAGLESFTLTPSESEFKESEHRSKAAVDSIRFIDVKTQDTPGRVLECLHRSRLLAGAVGFDQVTGPQLQLVTSHHHAGNTDRSFYLTFEDTA
jgi:hypothetical protein